MRTLPGQPRHHGAARLLFLGSILAVLSTAAVNSQLAQIHNVYILPMASGMDQYLASRLTTRGVFQVVSDPQRADAILTDHIGESFESRMDELYAPPKKKTEGETSGFVAPPPPISTFSRGRGSFFLVDRRTRSVLWSLYQRPHSTRPDDLSHTADKIAVKLADNLQKAANPPRK